MISRPRPPHSPMLRRRTMLLGLLGLLATSQSTRSAPMPMKILARSTAPVALGAGPVVVPLTPAGKSLSAQLAAMAPGHSLYLLVRGLTAEEAPGVLYSVYLDLPAGTTPGENDPRRVGIIHFYNARRPGAANAPDAASPVNTDAEQVFFSFEITPVARALRRSGQLTERTTLTLIPEGVPIPGAKPLIGHLELVEQ